MLTLTEFEQLTISFQAMAVVNIGGRLFVDQGNVLAILARWVEDQESNPRIVATNKHTEDTLSRG